jgi:hypothetical protein
MAVCPLLATVALPEGGTSAARVPLLPTLDNKSNPGNGRTCAPVSFGTLSYKQLTTIH